MKRRVKRIKKECWLCGKTGYKYFADHHVMTIGEDPDLVVKLCRGCHWLVSLLSRFNLIRHPKKMEDLICLTRSQAGLPNFEIEVKYKEVS